MTFFSKPLISYVRFEHADKITRAFRARSIESKSHHRIWNPRTQRGSFGELLKLSLENDSPGRCSPGLPIIVLRGETIPSIHHLTPLTYHWCRRVPWSCPFSILATLINVFVLIIVIAIITIYIRPHNIFMLALCRSRDHLATLFWFLQERKQPYGVHRQNSLKPHATIEMSMIEMTCQIKSKTRHFFVINYVRIPIGYQDKLLLIVFSIVREY